MKKEISNKINLVLLTEWFPFGTQEAFLEEEIKFLSKRFEKIHLYSFAPQKENQTREVPNNVTVIKVRKSDPLHLSDYLFLLSSLSVKDIIFTATHYKYKLRGILSSLVKLYAVSKRTFLPYLLQENQNNTIFYSYWFSHLSFALACLKLERPDAVCITRAHRFDNFVEYNSCFMRKFILNHIDAVFPISIEGVKSIQSKMLPYCPNCKPIIAVHHLGVRLSKIVNPKFDDTIRIVSCSNVIPIKRLDLIIDALSKINDKNIEWVHFGSGRDLIKIKEYAYKKLHKKSNINYNFMGYTKHEDILQYYKNKHVELFINASDHEGIPVSVMEAMAAGILCIARNVGGNAELVIDNDTGFLLPMDIKPKELFEKIQYAIGLPSDQKNAIRKNAIKKIQNDFDVNVVYEKFVNNIFELVDNKV